MKWIQIIQLILAILLMVAILLQNRGAGLSEVFGGSGGAYRTKRGMEKILFFSTIVLAVLFFAASLVNFLF